MKARKHFSKSRVTFSLGVLAASFLALTASGALSGKEIPGLKEASAAYAAGNFPDAKERFLALNMSNPRNAKILEKIAELYLLENNAALSKVYYERAIRNTPFLKRIWPRSVELYLNAALAYFRDNDFAGTERYVGKAAGPFGISFIKELTAAQKQLELFKGVVPYSMTGAERTSVAFEQLDPLPVIKVRVNGSEPLRFLLDTGAEDIYIDRGVAARVNVVSVDGFAFPKGTTAGSGGENGLGKVDRLQIGDIEISDVPASIVDMENISNLVFEGRAVDGIIGTRVLMQFLSTIDYKNQQLVLRRKTRKNIEDFNARLRDKTFSRIPFYLFSTHFILTRGSFNGQNEGLYFVDTGVAAAGLLSSEDRFRSSGVAVDWSKSRIGAGVGGKAEVLELQIDEVSLGTGPNKITRKNVKGVLMKENLAIFDGQLGFELMGLISHELFKGTALTFDFDNMELVIER